MRDVTSFSLITHIFSGVRTIFVRHFTHILLKSQNKSFINVPTAILSSVQNTGAWKIWRHRLHSAWVAPDDASLLFRMCFINYFLIFPVCRLWHRSLFQRITEHPVYSLGLGELMGIDKTLQKDYSAIPPLPSILTVWNVKNVNGYRELNIFNHRVLHGYPYTFRWIKLIACFY